MNPVAAVSIGGSTGKRVKSNEIVGTYFFDLLL